MAEASTLRRGAQSAPRSLRLAAAGLVGSVAIASGALLVFRHARQAALPNIRVAGAGVGGLDGGALRRALTGVAQRMARERLTVIRPASGAFSRRAITATLGEIGYRLDVEATAGEVLARGRQANPVPALADQLRATFGSIDLRPRFTLDPGPFDAWLRRAVGSLTSPPSEGGISFDGARPEGVEPHPGRTVSPDELAQEVRRALAASGPLVVSLVPRTARPATDHHDVLAVLGLARKALSGPVTLKRGGHALVFRPVQLAKALRTAPVTTAQGTRLELRADPAVVRGLVGSRSRLFFAAAVPARFTSAEDSVHLIPSRPGFRFDPAIAARQLVDVATSDRRVAVLQGRLLLPSLTTAQARALHVTERVSSFTTYHPCCQARVTNIHRTADLLQGAVVRPGEVFSLNGFVGQRTPAKGFVKAPAIAEGEIVDQYGGGISQFTTTMYNAIFFGGYQILEHQAHSFYFTRYPPGREATLSWPSPDLRFRNDSRAGIYIATSYTDSSITVSFYGTQNLKVESVTGRPTHLTEPPTKCSANADVGPGGVIVTQEGSQGFDIVVQRILISPGGARRVETYATHYRPEPRLEERRSCASPSPSATPSASTSPSPSPRPSG